MKIENFFKQHDDVECLCDRLLDVDTCCETLKKRLNNCRIGIRYDRQDRSYAIKERYMSGYNSITHCPWCGSKLPSDLYDTREEVLKKEFGIDEDDRTQAKKVPAEFLTDEWWKKRGL
jgi:hypothetical protein